MRHFVDMSVPPQLLEVMLAWIQDPDPDPACGPVINKGFWNIPCVIFLCTRAKDFTDV